MPFALIEAHPRRYTLRLSQMMVRSHHDATVKNKKNPEKGVPLANTTKMSLGKAIQTLDPQADSKAQAKKAMVQAKQDANKSGS
jgi:hypothetical protein